MIYTKNNIFYSCEKIEIFDVIVLKLTESLENKK